VDASDLSPASADASPLKQLEQSDLRDLLRRALDQLPETLKTAVVLRDLHELSYQEIAERLGLPEGTVKSRINRGRLELARQIKRSSAAASASALEARRAALGRTPPPGRS
jgi:RNA polymerase sigma-70 factor (ECF subfamily)